MSKFKVGDELWCKSLGCLVVVHSTQFFTKGYDQYFGVNYGDYGQKMFTFVKESNLVPPRLADTKINRKLHKNKIRKIEKGWIYLNA